MTGPDFCAKLSFFKTGLIDSPSQGSTLGAPYSVRWGLTGYEYKGDVLCFWKRRDCVRLDFVHDVLLINTPQIEQIWKIRKYYNRENGENKKSLSKCIVLACKNQLYNVW